MHVCVCGTVYKTVAPFGVVCLAMSSSPPHTLFRTRLLFCDSAPWFLLSSGVLWLFILTRHLLYENAREVGPWSPARTVSPGLWGASQTLFVLFLNVLLTCTTHTEMYIYHTYRTQGLFTKNQHTRAISTQTGNQNILESLCAPSTDDLPKGNHYPDCFLLWTSCKSGPWCWAAHCIFVSPPNLHCDRSPSVFDYSFKCQQTLTQRQLHARHCVD